MTVHDLRRGKIDAERGELGQLACLAGIEAERGRAVDDLGAALFPMFERGDRIEYAMIVRAQDARHREAIEDDTRRRFAIRRIENQLGHRNF